MNIRPFYVFQKAAFPSDFCDRVVKEGELLPHEADAMIGPTGENTNPEKRQTELAFVPQQAMYRWVYENVQACVNAANAQFWNFRLSTVEPLQYGIYRPGQFYTWHADQHPRPYEDGPDKGLTRKLTISVQLSEGDDYEGGEFELRQPCDDNSVERIEGIRARGSVIIFPSFVMHRVTPVTGGERRSLVGWVLGPPFV